MKPSPLVANEGERIFYNSVNSDFGGGEKKRRN